MSARKHFICTVPNCGQVHKSRGYCAMHYSRMQKGVPLEAPKCYNRLIKRGWIHAGYRWLSTADGEVMEHRYRMEQHLGRKLHVDEVVHHKNGDKLDNRLGNLEVMARARHTSHHRAHRQDCFVCHTDDPHGRHGLCAIHANKVAHFLRRFSISLPQSKYAVAVLYMGTAHALATHEAEKRIASLLYERAS